MEAHVLARWRTTTAVAIIVIFAVVLLWEVVVGFATSRWNLPVLTFLAFALWIAIYVFLSAHEESA